METKLNLSFLTAGEKMRIMVCPPISSDLNQVKSYIISKREKEGGITLDFIVDLDRLIQSRNKGYPKKLPKPNKI